MLFRYKVKKSEEYTFHEYVTHYTIIIQMFNSKKSKWKNFSTIDLGKLLQVSTGTEWDNQYLIRCIDVLNASGGIDSALKDHIKTVLKENNEINEQELKAQDAIHTLNKMFAAHKSWTVIEIEEE